MSGEQKHKIPSEKETADALAKHNAELANRFDQYREAFRKQAEKFRKAQKHAASIKDRRHRNIALALHNPAPPAYHPSIPWDVPNHSEELGKQFLKGETKFDQPLNSSVQPYYSAYLKMQGVYTGRGAPMSSREIPEPSLKTEKEREVFYKLSTLESLAWEGAKQRPLDISELQEPVYEERRIPLLIGSGFVGYYACQYWRKNRLEHTKGHIGRYLAGTYPRVKGLPPYGSADVYLNPEGAKPSFEKMYRADDLFWYIVYAPDKLLNGMWNPHQILTRVRFVQYLMTVSSIDDFCDVLCYAPAACYADGEYPHADILRALFMPIVATYAIEQSTTMARASGYLINDEFFATNLYSNMLNKVFTSPMHVIDHAKARIRNGKGEVVNLHLPQPIKNVLYRCFEHPKVKQLIEANLRKLAGTAATAQDEDKVYTAEDLNWNIYENPLLVYDPVASGEKGKAIWTNIGMPSSKHWNPGEHYLIGTKEQKKYMERAVDIRRRYARTIETQRGLRSQDDSTGKKRRFPWVVAAIAAGVVASQAT